MKRRRLRLWKPVERKARARRGTRAHDGEEPIVGPDEPAALGFQHDSAALAPDAGIYDAEHDRLGGQAADECSKKMRVRDDIECWRVVQQVDHCTSRRSSVQHGFHLADVNIRGAEIGEKKNRQIHAAVQAMPEREPAAGRSTLST